MSFFITFPDHEASKVHFSTDLSLNTEINVVCKNDEIDVHVGFLQEGHIYEIQFAIPNRFPDGWKQPELIDPELQIISIDSVGTYSFQCTIWSDCCSGTQARGGRGGVAKRWFSSRVSSETR